MHKRQTEENLSFDTDFFNKNISFKAIKHKSILLVEKGKKQKWKKNSMNDMLWWFLLQKYVNKSTVKTNYFSIVISLPLNLFFCSFIWYAHCIWMEKTTIAITSKIDIACLLLVLMWIKVNKKKGKNRGKS